MVKVILKPRSGFTELKPLRVDTDGKGAPGASADTCVGIGTLRDKGYDVSEITAVVHRIGEIDADRV